MAAKRRGLLFFSLHFGQKACRSCICVAMCVSVLHSAASAHKMGAQQQKQQLGWDFRDPTLARSSPFPISNSQPAGCRFSFLLSVARRNENDSWHLNSAQTHILTPTRKQHTHTHWDTRKKKKQTLSATSTSSWVRFSCQCLEFGSGLSFHKFIARQETTK